MPRDERRSLSLAAIPHDHLGAGLGQVGCHPLAHDAYKYGGEYNGRFSKRMYFVSKVHQTTAVSHR